MSDKHYFPETLVNSLVPRALEALTIANPTLSFIESERVVFNNTHNPYRVSLISGGGSGHEPAWAGYVGDGLLSAVACGDIFASPSMKQVLSAIAAVPSDEGTILLITNYTGDKLHFGLAAERALANGLAKKVAVLPATDDVSIGRRQAERVGRRGLAGNVVTMKILGAAAAKEYSFDLLVQVGKAVNEQLVSIGSALDHCHVPGRQNHETLPRDACYVGAGIHNEPGAERVSPIPPVEDLIHKMLSLLCDHEDEERAFVKFDDGDAVVLLINNYGGLSNLELGALTHETLQQLETKWQIKPCKIYSGGFETSLNGPCFSITLCNLSNAAKNCELEVEQLMDLLGAETGAPSWPNVNGDSGTRREKPPLPVINTEKQSEVDAGEDVKVEPRLLAEIIRRGCERAIEAEPELTKWDMIMGDGDCGEGVKAVCEAILQKLHDGKIASTGSILTALHSIIHSIDDMGGSLGAIIGIFLSEFSSSLQSLSRASPEPKKSTKEIISRALSSALKSLQSYTGARVGDRTVMDVLIPFTETLAEGSMKKAVEKAEKAAERTRGMSAMFGRASYVGVGKGRESVPDPGAWAAMVVLRGMGEVIEGGS